MYIEICFVQYNISKTQRLSVIINQCTMSYTISILQISNIFSLSATTPDAVRQNPRAAKRKRRAHSKDSQVFILQIGQLMIQQSEAKTRLQEIMLALMQPMGGDLKNPIQAFHRTMAVIAMAKAFTAHFGLNTPLMLTKSPRNSASVFLKHFKPTCRKRWYACVYILRVQSTDYFFVNEMCYGGHLSTGFLSTCLQPLRSLVQIFAGAFNVRKLLADACGFTVQDLICTSS